MSSVDIQGHRGARGLLPENSLPAFQLALDLGVTTLEMDTVVSKDKRVVLSHDPYFSPEICLQPDGTRIPDGMEGAFRLFDRNYDEIRSFDCGSLGNPRFKSQRATAVRKPLLEEVIEFSEAYAVKISRPAPHYNIETKSTPAGDGVLHPQPAEFVELLLDVIRSKHVLDRCIIQSFDPRTLRECRLQEPRIRTALLISNQADEGVETNVENLGFTPSIYSPDKSLVDKPTVEKCHGLGMLVIPWTINDERQLGHIVSMGVDGVITDYPDRAMRLAGAGWITN